MFVWQDTPSGMVRGKTFYGHLTRPSGQTPVYTYPIVSCNDHDNTNTGPWTPYGSYTVTHSDNGTTETIDLECTMPCTGWLRFEICGQTWDIGPTDDSFVYDEIERYNSEADGTTVCVKSLFGAASYEILEVTGNLTAVIVDGNHLQVTWPMLAEPGGTVVVRGTFSPCGYTVTQTLNF
jgi:hypothetical protein